MARRKEAAHGGHGWFVTFADLMGLLVSFFVMLVAFSTQDQQKLQVVAGSMREAFGVQDRVRYSGIIEVLGLPTRPSGGRPRKLPQRRLRTKTITTARMVRGSRQTANFRSPLPHCGKPCSRCRTSRNFQNTSWSKKRSRVSISSWSTRMAVPCLRKAQRCRTSARARSSSGSRRR